MLLQTLNAFMMTLMSDFPAGFTWGRLYTLAPHRSEVHFGAADGPKSGHIAAWGSVYLFNFSYPFIVWLVGVMGSQQYAFSRVKTMLSITHNQTRMTYRLHPSQSVKASAQRPFLEFSATRSSATPPIPTLVLPPKQTPTAGRMANKSVHLTTFVTTVPPSNSATLSRDMESAKVESGALISPSRVCACCSSIGH